MASTWRCHQCGEFVSGFESVCWNCGSKKESRNESTTEESKHSHADGVSSSNNEESGLASFFSVLAVITLIGGLFVAFFTGRTESRYGDYDYNILVMGVCYAAFLVSGMFSLAISDMLSMLKKIESKTDRLNRLTEISNKLETQNQLLQKNLEQMKAQHSAEDE